MNIQIYNIINYMAGAFNHGNAYHPETTCFPMRGM